MAVVLPNNGRLRRLLFFSAVVLVILFFFQSPAHRYTQYFKPNWQSPHQEPVGQLPEDNEHYTPQLQSQHEPPQPPQPQQPERLPQPPRPQKPQEPEPKPYVPASEPDNQPEKPGTPRSRVPEELQQVLAWDPPKNVKGHYPPYGEYANRDYDPNRWEAFEQNTAFFLNGTIKNLAADDNRPRFYLPYPSYNSPSWRARWKGSFVDCDGPRGRPLNTSAFDIITCRRNTDSGFPPPEVGSFEAIGIDQTACFDRFSKLAPYGLAPEQHEDGWEVNWQHVQWGQLQNACLQRNADRFEYSEPTNVHTGMLSPANVTDFQEPVELQTSSNATHKSRTAILIRAWGDYEYHDNDVQAIRALVTELSLLSGGEYQIFLFVNIKDLTIPIFTDPEEYQKALERTVPDEFRDMAILWNEDIGKIWYPDLETHEVYWSQFMPVQWFSKLHPEFDFIWNWEMDVRHIGQTYHFLEKLSEFARKQPRKHLWERNSRFYFPANHGSWEDFLNSTNSIAAASPYVKSVWGPQPWSESQISLGPTPPVPEEQDDYNWGVGEEADFITLLPIWDPIDTDWSYRTKVFKYPDLPEDQRRKPFAHIPRRTYINTMVRMSKKLLHAMHLENEAGYSMASEMWPSSVALQHGLKAVYAPHPIWFSHKWPAFYLDAVFNADGWGAGSIGTLDNGRGIAWDAAKASRREPQSGSGPNKEGALGRWSAQRDAVYSPDREHNFGCFSWYFWSDFPKVIYARWLGWKAHLEHDRLGDVGDADWENRHGRLCLPSMLLHPVKAVVAGTGDMGKPVDSPPPTHPIVFEDEVFKPGAGRVDTNAAYERLMSPNAP